MPSEPPSDAVDDQDQPNVQGDQVTDEPDQEPTHDAVADTPDMDDGVEQSTADDDDPLRLTKWYDEVYGDNASTRFTNDAEFLRSVRELRTAIRQRDEDAQRGKLIPPERMQEVMEYLQSKQQPQQASTSEGTKAPTWEEFQLLQSQIRSDKSEVPSDQMRMAQELSTKVAKTAYLLATDPEQVLGPLLKQREQTIAEQTQQWLQSQAAQQQEIAALNQFEQENAEWLYVDKQPPPPGAQGQLTKEGLEFIQAARRLKAAEPHMSNLGVFRVLAEQRAARLEAQRQPTRKASPAARHRPAVSPAPDSAGDEDFDFLQACMRDSGML